MPTRVQELGGGCLVEAERPACAFSAQVRSFGPPSSSWSSSSFDARSRWVNGSRERAAPRERLEERWQIMMLAAGRVAPALRGRQSCRMNDRSRPTARRTSTSGRARGIRASNKPCHLASLLHRAPNERNRVDARALGREWFLEKWPNGQWENLLVLITP